MIEKLLIDFNRGIANDIYVNVGIIIYVKIKYPKRQGHSF